MIRSRIKILGVIIAAAIAAAIAIALIIPPAPPPAKEYEIKWAITEPGTAGYAFISAASTILNPSPELEISIRPYKGHLETLRLFALATGEVDMAYTNTMYLRELHEGVGVFEDFKPKMKPCHTFWYTTIPTGMATTLEIAEKYGIKSWKDFSNKPAFYCPPGYFTHVMFKRYSPEIGLEMKHVEVDYKVLADMLKGEKILGTCMYFTGYSPPPWLSELSLKVKLKAINPSQDEFKKLEAAGAPLIRISNPKERFGIDIGVDEFLGFVTFFGFVTHPDIVPEEAVYKILKEITKPGNAEALVGATKVAKEFVDDPVGMQVKAINSAPDVPVHPGLAKWLKEKGAWNPEWKICS